MIKLIEKAKQIKLVILDVDGTLTDGTIYCADNGMELKRFHVHDGLGIKLLRQAGMHVAAISNRASPATAQRLAELQVEHIYLACNDKLTCYAMLKQKLKLDDNQIACMGDDLPDLPLLQRVGFAITVPHAPTLLKQQADYITLLPAGKGAVREASELILQLQGKLNLMIDSYLAEKKEACHDN